jgi:hypothetical protein
MDFTDSANPVEIAFFDRGPVDSEELVMGGYWSAYWYNGVIYGTEIARGLDVFELTPSDYLSENELAAAALTASENLHNPQQQRKLDWPADPVVAKAYMDQLRRAGALNAAQDQTLSAALDDAAAALSSGGSNASVAARLASLATSLEDEAMSRTGATQTRYQALLATVEGIAGRLR